MLISIAGSASGAVGSSPSTGGATGELTVADDIVVCIAGCATGVVGSSPSTGGGSEELTVADDMVVTDGCVVFSA